MCQVTSAVGEILEELGWDVENRGEIDVKGKGKMFTHLVDPVSAPTAKSSLQSTSTNENSTKHRKSADSCARSPPWKGKASLASIKYTLDSKKRSFDVSSRDRGISLPADDEVAKFSRLNTFDSSHRTLPKTIKFANMNERLCTNEFSDIGRMERQAEQKTSPPKEDSNFTDPYDKTIPKLSERVKKKYYAALEKFSENDKVNPLTEITEEVDKEDISVSRSNSSVTRDPSVHVGVFPSVSECALNPNKLSTRRVSASTRIRKSVALIQYNDSDLCRKRGNRLEDTSTVPRTTDDNKRTTIVCKSIDPTSSIDINSKNNKEVT